MSQENTKVSQLYHSKVWRGHQGLNFTSPQGRVNVWRNCIILLSSEGSNVTHRNDYGASMDRVIRVLL